MKKIYKQLLLSLCAMVLNTFAFAQSSLEPPEFELYYYPGEQDFIVLTFDNDNPGSSTEIYHSLSENSGYTLVATVNPGVTTYEHSNLKPRTTHYYKLKARSGSQVSDFSEVYYWTTYSKNYAPIVTARAINANTVELTVTDKSYNDTGYEIFTTEGPGVYAIGDFYQDFYFPGDSGETKILYHHPVEAGKTYYYTVKLIPHYDQFEQGYYNIATFTMPLPNCNEAGTVEREVWTNITGGKVSSIPTYATPNKITVLNSLQGPVNDGDNFGARVRGYFCVPQTGNYTFWISSDDQSELWVSTDATVANKKLVASVTGYTSVNQWDKYPTQKSAQIPLQAGSTYYFEMLHKESGSGDHFAVGWTLPDGTLERPIGGNRLIRYGRPNAGPEVTITSPTYNALFTAPATVTLSANAFDPESAITKIDFYLNSTLIQSDATAPFSVTASNLPAASYMMMAVAHSADGQQGYDYEYFNVQAPSCAGTGGIKREIWTNIPGTSTTTVPVNTPPNSVDQLTSFETTQYRANNYGSRIRGYLCVPLTGSYKFWLSADDEAVLWLSTDESPDNKRYIGSVTRATKFREYYRDNSQFSGAIYLQAGKKYYIEAVHKDGSGNDFVSVRWEMPDGAVEEPIAGSRLIPFGATTQNQNPTVKITSPPDNFEENHANGVYIQASASDSDGTISKVEFYVNGEKKSTDTASPYEYHWTYFPEGTHQFVVVAYDNQNATASDTISYTVNYADCSGAGFVSWEFWDNISGTEISSIPVNTEPDHVQTELAFETQQYTGNNYGSRMRANLCLPASGNYTFWIAADDKAELWLSTDETPGNKRLIASVNTATRFQQYDKSASQKSAVIQLNRGVNYYIEVLHKESNGNDHISVGWQLPDGTLERPIQGVRLIPYDDNNTFAMSKEEAVVISNEESMSISLAPNPVTNQNFSIIGDALGSEAGPTRVMITNVSGTVVHESEVECYDCGSIDVTLNNNIVPGVYAVQIVRGKRKDVLKLLVK